MKRCKFAAVLLCACLFLGAAAPAGAADGGGPKVTVSCVKVAEDKTLEVSLVADAPAFRSVGAVLCYDESRLELLDWSGTPSPLGIPKTATSWDRAVSLAAAKGSDLTPVQPSLAYRGTDGVRLYVAGGLFDCRDINMRVVTLRFRCVDEDEAGSKLSALTLTEIGPDGTLLSLASAADARAMIAGQVQCTVGSGGAETVYTYASGAGDRLRFSWPAPRPGSSVAGAGDAEAVGVTFLDWDGSVLATAALPLSDYAPVIVGGMASVQGSRMYEALAEGKKPGYRFEAWLDYNRLIEEEEPPLTANNDGLDRERYGGLVVDLNEFSTYFRQTYAAEGGTRAIALQACYRAKTMPDGEYDESFRPIGGAGDSTYWINDGAQENGGFYFTRYGYASSTLGRYAVRIQINRTGEDGAVGVERINEPGVVVHMHAKDGADFYTLQRAENREIIRTELVPTREMEWVEFTLVDTYGVAAWPNAGSRTGTAYRIDMADVIRLGTANFIMEQAYLELSGDPESCWDAYVDEQAFLDATGTPVSDLAQTKRLFLEWMEAVYFPGGAPHPARRVSAAAETVILDADVPRAFGPEEEWMPPSYDDFLNTYNELGVEVSCTVRSYDPKKLLTCALYRWDDALGDYGAQSINTDINPVPAWTAELEQSRTDWSGNGAGTGAYSQTLTLSGLQPGKYRLRVGKESHAAVTVEFEVAYLRSQVADSALPEYTLGRKLPIDLSGLAGGEERFGVFPLPCGDLNGDGFVRIDDLGRLMQADTYGKPAPAGGGLARFDLNGDGVINAVDSDLLTSPGNLGRGAYTVEVAIP